MAARTLGMAGPQMVERLRALAAGLAAGGAAGALVGGVGGRVAMLLLRLTSDPALHGSTTDDGFVIGIVSTSTIFLLVLTTIIGATVGVLYLLVRPWLPERQRPWVAGLLGATVGGAGILRPGGVDFTLLEPLPLAVAMFIAIPAGVGVVTSLLAERFLSPGSVIRRSRAALATLLLAIPVALLPLTAGLSAPGIVGPAALASALVRLLLFGRRLARAWSSPSVRWIGRGLLALAAAVSTVALVRDVSAIL